MQSAAQAVIASWSIPPAASFALALTAIIYLRGWLLMRRAGVPFVPLWRAASFLLGILSLWVALASPLDTFSGFVLTAHMLQHMVLMMIAPPLILLGAPLVPLVRGLPVFAAREFAGPFLNWRVAMRIGNALIHPAVALIIMGAAMFAWHTPRLYELALASGAWHEVEHACFFLASLIFWWPVIQPWPSHTVRPRWMLVPYLLIGDLQNTVLSAILVFSDRVIYPSYVTMPRLFGFSALADQAAAGAIMWVVGSTVFLIPATVIAVQLLSDRRTTAARVSVPRQEASLDAIFTVGRRLAFPSRMLRRRFGDEAVEAFSFVVLFVAAGLCAAALATSGSDDDDQTLRLSQIAGPFVVSVFALPGDLDAGSSEFNVLVQDRDTLQVVQDANVALQARDDATSQSTEAVQASAEDSENKLLQNAELELPAEGDWTLSVKVVRNDTVADVAVPLHVVKPEGGISVPWPYIAFGIFAAVLLFSYWRRNRASGKVGVRSALPDSTV
jgi:cytochrome c oxidase assembly factor CtaG